MKKILILLIGLTFILSCSKSQKEIPSTYTFTEPYEIEKIDKTIDFGNNSKNVVLMIGDGMSLMDVYTTWTANRGKLNICDNCQYIGLSKTYCFDKLITDSGAGGTAIAAGQKVKYHSVGVDTNGKPLPTLIDMAKSKGKSTGIIVTCRLNDATPADFCCHNMDRDKDEEIIADYLKCGVDFVVGGGKVYFTQRKDKRNIIDELKKAGYQTPGTIEEVMQIKDGKVFAVVAEKDLDVPKKRGNYLSQATKKAIEILSQNKNGFFLMVEGSQMDDYGHFNDIDLLIQEIVDFDKVVGEVFKYAENDKQTLVVVTADHETGGLTLIGGEKKTGTVKVSFSTKEHSGVMVPVYSYGPNANLFTGAFENSDICKKINSVLK